jgi:hypothetical protein
VTIESLAAPHRASLHTIHRILREDLGLEKKTARWVPRLLSTDKKKSESVPALNSSPSSSATPWR